MRLEVLAVNSGDVQIYPLNRPKIIIGSGDVCDIVLSVEGVSRKHVIVSTENDQFYVADQGSTNGTYINEERLQPGKRVEFTSFFPVRLGEHVLLTLLSDEDSNGLDFSDFNKNKNDASSPSIKVSGGDRTDATRTVSLNELNQTKTQSLVKKRKEIQKTRQAGPPPRSKAKEKSQDKSRMLLAKLMAIVLVGGAFYYTVFMKEKPIEEDPTVAKVGEVKVATPEEIAAVQGPKYVLPESEKTPYENLIAVTKDLRCVSDVEKYLCENVMGAKENPWGAAQIKLTLNIVVDGTTFLEDARKHVPLPKETNQEIIDQYLKDVNETAIASFFVYAIPAGFNYELLKDYTLVIGLANPTADKIEIAAIITPEGLQKLKEKLSEESLLGVRQGGVKNLAFTHNYYRVY